MLESSRRSLLRALNSRHIYGRLPLLHLIIFLFEMAAVSLLVQKFNASYARRPLLTTMVTNAILGGIADTTAQMITAVRQNSSSRSNHGYAPEEGFELDEKSPSSPTRREILPERRNLPPPFDFERLTRFMSYGFLVTPLQFKWFGWLAKSFPITETAATLPALKRVAFDQILYAPFGLGLFFTFMTIAEGGGEAELGKKMRESYLPALKANYVLWPAVQILNFRVMPIQFQIPFVSTIGIAWTAYLSLSNASD